MFKFEKSESFEKPVKIDNKSSSSGVYIRINCTAEPVSDTAGNEKIKYSYLEAFVPKNEFEEFKFVSKVQGKDVSAAQIEYDYRLNMPIEYKKTGFTYKAKWAETYDNLIKKGKESSYLFPMQIFDTTKTEERSVKMSINELEELAKFLTMKQQEFFNEKKQAEV